MRRAAHPLVEWLKLGTLGSPEITLGVSRSGSWVIDTADGLADAEDALTFAFPILNSSYDEVHMRLAEFERCVGPSIWREFPLDKLVVHAILGGGYWAEQAFPWLQSVILDTDNRKIVMDGLIEIETNREFSQSLRQKARRCRRKLAQG